MVYSFALIWLKERRKGAVGKNTGIFGGYIFQIFHFPWFLFGLCADRYRYTSKMLKEPSGFSFQKKRSRPKGSAYPDLDVFLHIFDKNVCYLCPSTCMPCHHVSRRMETFACGHRSSQRRKQNQRIRPHWKLFGVLCRGEWLCRREGGICWRWTRFCFCRFESIPAQCPQGPPQRHQLFDDHWALHCNWGSGRFCALLWYTGVDAFIFFCLDGRNSNNVTCFSTCNPPNNFYPPPPQKWTDLFGPIPAELFGQSTRLLMDWLTTFPKEQFLLSNVVVDL